MVKVMNKKGTELPLNVVIVAILVILVLVVVIIFFLGGFGGLTSKIKSTFFGTLAGTDKSIAVETCKTRCEQARLLGEAGINPLTSAFCTSPFYIDTDNNGEADKFGDSYVKFYCHKSSPTDAEQNLDISCMAFDTAVQKKEAPLNC